MMKHIRSLGSAAAALAVSATFVAAPAFAQGAPAAKHVQHAQELSGAPGFRGEHEFRGDREVRGAPDWRGDRDEDWRGEGDWRRRAPDFQTAQAQCSRAGIQMAWNQGFYSAQYDGKPRFVEARRGWELHGRMRLHNQRGYSHVNTICDMRGRGDARIEFVR